MIADPLSEADSIIVRGGGRLILAAANTFTDGVVVESGELVVRNPAAVGTGLLDVRAGARVFLDIPEGDVAVGRLELAETATLDVGSGRLTIAAEGFSVEQLRRWVLAGRSGGTWNGPGITSSAAAATLFHGVGLRALPDGTALVGFAAVGDATMDGTVDAQDLIALNAGGRYGTAARDSGWWQGDFNYDGRVDVSDLILLQATGLYGSGSYQPSRTGPAVR